MRAYRLAIWTMALMIITAPIASAQEGAPPQDAQEAIGATPPRLSFVDGQVTFWRPGTEDWVDARINTPLAPGDQLSVGPDGNLELQIGPRAFVRAGADARITLDRREPDFIQFKVVAGTVALDLRQVEPGRMVSVQTPHGAFTMEAEGYYRLDVDDGQTQFITRRTGRAVADLASGEKVPIEPNALITVDGRAGGRLTAEKAPALDEWDRWNYARTDEFLEARTSGYVSPEVYGVQDLDHYGAWTVTAAYGPVWRPYGVSAGWVPYSTGAWISDPYYGWTWVDTAPWGWAPYHYGRWVYVSSHWCWAPGPRVVRPLYAPALVAFFGEPGVQVSVAIGGPVIGWVALGWGEPLVPWWGRPGFIHRPWWGGWGGPHCLNGRVINRGTVIDVAHINLYQNMHRHHAMVMMEKNHFGRGPVTVSHINSRNVNSWRPLHGAPLWTAPRGNKSPANHRFSPRQGRHEASVRPPVRHTTRSPESGPRTGSSRVDKPERRPFSPDRMSRERSNRDEQRAARSRREDPVHNRHQPLAPQQPSPRQFGPDRAPASRQFGPDRAPASRQLGPDRAPASRSGARSMAPQPQSRPDASYGSTAPATREWRPQSSDGGNRRSQGKEERPARRASPHGSHRNGRD